MAITEKVVSMGVGKVFQEIENFLKNKGNKSMNTRVSYEREIRRFFELIKRKKIEFLTRDDVQITFDDLEHFVNMAIEQKDENNKQLFNNKTINHYVSVVGELLRYLHMKKIVDDISFLTSLKIIKLKENDNEHGVLEVYELYNLLAFIKKEEEFLKDEKYMFVYLSADTMLRKSAILNLKWSDFEVKKDQVIIRAIDKGNKDFRKYINHDTYEKLLEIRQENSEKVFNLSSGVLQKMMERFKKHFDIPDSRRIVIHSIRKCAAEELYRESNGDIMTVKDALGHANVNTSQKYLNKDKSSIMGMFSRGLNYNRELYKGDNISHELLIQAIDELSEREKLLINKKIEEILKDNKENNNLSKELYSN